MRKILRKNDKLYSEVKKGLIGSKMTKYDTWVRSYEIHRPIGGVYKWGARGVIYTDGKEIETEEVWGQTKDEAEVKAREALDKKFKTLKKE